MAPDCFTRPRYIFAMPARANFPRLAVLMILVAFAALSVDITIPVMSSFAAAFNVSGAAAQLTLSVFVLAFATTHLLAGPLSDRLQSLEDADRRFFVSALCHVASLP